MPSDARVVRRALPALLSKLTSAERVSRFAKLLIRNPRFLAAYVREALHDAERAGGYQAWVEKYDAMTPQDMLLLRSAASALRDGPLISLIMPVYDPPLSFLERAIQSIAQQAYGNWELCIADDCSTNAEVAPFLQRLASEDPRIKMCRRRENGGIAAASGSALELARGDYVALIDQDDEIPPHALLLVAREIAADPAVDLIYTDEDKIDERGRRFDPYFKPDWNPALILSQNYFSHLGVYRRSLIERVGGFRDAFNGSQDYDLLLRCAELTRPERIRHIPHVLYHWRAIAGSAATTADAKPYAITAGKRAVQDALDRRRIRGTVSVTQGQYYRIDYRLPDELPLVSVLIPSQCRSTRVERCLLGLLERTPYPRLEVLLLVSEGSRRAAMNAPFWNRVRRDPRVKVLAYPDRPFNFSWINNWGARQALGSVLCFLNDDTEVIDPDWLEQLVVRLVLPEVGAVGPMLCYPNGTIQHAGTILGLSGIADHAHRFAVRGTTGYFGRAALEQDFSCITAACAVVSKEAFEGVGGFDEDFAVAFNDVDLCIRLMQAGWRIVWTPNVALYHHESGTLGPQDSPERERQFREEQHLMLRKWGDMLKSDKHYNPNLSLAARHGFKLAFPPRVDWRASLAQVQSVATCKTP